MTMVTGLEVSQLALLNMNEVIKQEKKILVHGHADMIANGITNFYDNHDSSDQLKPWFNNMPPESRARLLYALTIESPFLDDKLAKRIYDIKRYKSSPFKPAPLSVQEIEQLENGLNEEGLRWVAITQLLSFWINESFVYRKVNGRQIDETFCRFNSDGQVMLVSDYGNNLMPYIVWEKLKSYLNRVNSFVVLPLNHSIKFSDDDVMKINRVIMKFNDYFNAFSSSRYEKITYELSDKKFEFVIYNGGDKVNKFSSNNDMSLRTYQLGMYHLALSKVFPTEYENESSDLFSLIHNPKKLLNEKINSIIDDVTEHENTIGEIKKGKEIINAIKNKDINKLLDLLSED